MDIWNSKEDHAEWDAILESSPEDRYLIVIDTFMSLRDLGQSAIDGSLDENEESYVREIELPASAIAEYCDTNTNIDAQFIVELLHALHAETTKVKVFGGGPTRYGPKRSVEEFEYLLNKLWKVQDRLGNHLFSLSKNEDSRKKVAEELATNAVDSKETFIPTPLQKSILSALDGVQLTTSKLATACQVEERRLFKKGGIKELKQLEIVKNKRGYGYFRTDKPPEA